MKPNETTVRIQRMKRTASGWWIAHQKRHGMRTRRVERLLSLVVRHGGTVQESKAMAMLDAFAAANSGGRV